MRHFVLFVCVSLLLALHGIAQTTNAAKRALSLRESINLALEHNLELQIERYSPAVARYILGASYGAYDPTFLFKAEERFISQPPEIDPKKPGIDLPYEITTESFRSALSGRLPEGLAYDLTANTEFLNVRTDFASDPRNANLFPPDGIRTVDETFSSAAIILRQPLLRDFWTDVYRQRIRIEKKNLKISEMALRWRIINIITAVELTYYDLIYAREKIRVDEKALELATELFSQTRKRVQVGDLPPLDEKQAEAQVETSQSNLFATQQLFAERENALKNLLTDDFPAWADLEIEPTERLIALQESFNRSESWQTAMSSRADLLQFRLELEKHDVIVGYRFNQLFPSLDVVGSYGVRAVQDSLSPSLADLRDRKNPEYSYGVVLSVPLSNQAARNHYKASQAARKQAQLQLKKLEQDIQVQIDNSIKQAQSTLKRVSSTGQARRFAEAALEAEQKKFQNGESTAFVVLELQQRLTAARTAEIQALTDYHKALAELALKEGSALERHKLSLEIQ